MLSVNIFQVESSIAVIHLCGVITKRTVLEYDRSSPQVPVSQSIRSPELVVSWARGGQKHPLTRLIHPRLQTPVGPSVL